MSSHSIPTSLLHSPAGLWSFVSHHTSLVSATPILTPSAWLFFISGFFYLCSFCVTFISNLYLTSIHSSGLSFSGKLLILSPFPNSLYWGLGLLLFLCAPLPSSASLYQDISTIIAYWYLALDDLTRYFNLRVWHTVSAKWIKYRSHSSNSIRRSIWINRLFSSFSSIMSHFHLYLPFSQVYRPIMMIRFTTLYPPTST